MLFFFYGSETLQPAEKIATLKAKFLEKNPAGAGMNTVSGDSDRALADIHELLFAASLFTTRRLVVIENPFTLPAAQQREIAELLPRISTDDVVVFWEKSAPRTNAVLFKKLIETAQTAQEYTALTPQKALTWIAKRADQNIPGTTVAKDAGEELAQRCGTKDLHTLANAIMVLAAHADGGRITRDMVTEMIPSNTEANAFGAIEQLTKNPQAALTSLEKQFEAGEDAFKLFGLYAYQIRTLLAVADCLERGITAPAAIAKETELKPFVITKATRSVTKNELPRLKKAYQHMAELDQAVKSGKRTMRDALTDLVANI